MFRMVKLFGEFVMDESGQVSVEKGIVVGATAAAAAGAGGYVIRNSEVLGQRQAVNEGSAYDALSYGQHQDLQGENLNAAQEGVVDAPSLGS
ncbi:MAG: hypothetical protein MI924_31960 [Chloroflexales bacterium]|nr:hypothetical protein [Chloroflexales bacterium]